MFEDVTTVKTETSLPLTPSIKRPEDEDYLYRRAEQELELAQAATHPAVVRAHYLLADSYLDSLYAEPSTAGD